MAIFCEARHNLKTGLTQTKLISDSKTFCLTTEALPWTAGAHGPAVHVSLGPCIKTEFDRVKILIKKNHGNL